MISIVIPAHNEEKRIGKTLEEYGKFFNEKLKNKEIKDYEILIVLNACKDKTLDAVKNIKRKYNKIKYIEFKKAGKGFAIIEGFKEALIRKNDLIGFVDADMATSPEAFYELVKNIRNYDGVIASRAKKGAIVKMTFLRKITHRGFNFIVRFLFLLPHNDTQCGGKIFKRRVIEKIIPELNVTEWVFDVNLLYLCKKYKFKIKEFPTIWENKEGSKITDVLRTSIQMFSGLIRLRLLNSFFEPILRPVKFISKFMHKFINKDG